MSEDKTLYKKILKSTTLFGGVQLFNIVIAVVRTKAISILIGPTGMGIAGLLNAVINVISGMSSLGLETSAVKFISQENANADRVALSRIVAVAKKAVWFSGIAGAVLTIALSHWLSLLTFGNTDYTYWFVWIAIALLFKQLSIGNIALLQGLQKLRNLAKANLMGSLMGLLISLPLYYNFKIDAIVPAIIASAVSIWFFAWYYSQHLEVDKVKIPNRQLLVEGRAMLGLGIMLSLSGLITTFVMYMIQIYIGNKSSISEVGLYNAGMILLNSYVALIFSAMSTDFFPRLSAVADDNQKVQKTVLHQAQIAVLILTPIIVLFVGFAPIAVELLFSDQFMPIVPMVSIGIIGMLFRAVSWSMGYILLAKGDSKMFIRTAFGFNALFLLLSVVGYNLYGLTGLGIAFMVHYFFHFVILAVLTKMRYQFELSLPFVKSFLICIILCASAYFCTFIGEELFRIGSLLLLMAGAIVFSAVHLHRKIDLRELYNQFKNKIK